MQKKLIVLGLMCLQVGLIVSQQDLEVPPDFCVGQEPGHYPHPDDCNGFIYCSNTGEAAAGRCIDDLHFRPDAPGVGVCTYPAEAGCDPNAGGSECNVGDFWEERVPQTCNQYIRCVNGETTTRRCADNLHWDSATQQCTTPVLSDCPYPICSENPTPGEVEVIPHPTDCNLYHICINGEPIERACAPGQHFDRINGWCTTPEEAQCEVTGSPDPGPEVPPEESTPEPDGETDPDGETEPEGEPEP